VVARVVVARVAAARVVVARVAAAVRAVVSPAIASGEVDFDLNGLRKKPGSACSHHTSLCMALCAASGTYTGARCVIVGATRDRWHDPMAVRYCSDGFACFRPSDHS
jgi:hypothetical protein